MRSTKQRSNAVKIAGITLALSPALVGSGCAVDDRQLADPSDVVGVGGSGGSDDSSDSNTGSPPGPGPMTNMTGAGGTTSELMPQGPLTNLAAGAVCRPEDTCVSPLLCDLTAAAGVSRCCIGCAADELCNIAGTGCEPRVRVQAEVCSSAAPCQSSLFCRTAQDEQDRCCAQDCSGGLVCTLGGSVCELRDEGVVCDRDAVCKSGYCDIDERLCTPNPCQAASASKYCARGAQCRESARCEFNGRGMVSAGAAHTCAILATGAVRCWGANDSGQLGAFFPEQVIIGDLLNETANALPGNQVTFGTLLNGRVRRAVQVSAGGGHTCALLNDGNVRCWGANNNNQLLPAKPDGDIALPSPAVAIDAGGEHTCALLATGAATCWGNNTLGQLGFGNRLPFSTGPLPLIAGLDTVREIRAGAGHTCAVLANNDLNCWGNPNNGELGHGNEAVADAPPFLEVNVGVGVASVGLGSGSTCVVTTTGSVRCWGNNRAGILGYGHTTDIGATESPNQASNIVLDTTTGQLLGGDVNLGPGVVDQVEVDTGSGYACARLGSRLRCWGDGNDGSTGYGNENDIGDDELPISAGDVPFGGSRTIVAMADGGRCVVFSDKTITCWGRDAQGELGYPALFPLGSPTLTPENILQSYGTVQFE
jgi:alpha-tubulin suppressor-like RCC1 family protein